MHVKYLADGIPEAPIFVLFDISRDDVRWLMSRIQALSTQAAEIVTINDLPGISSPDGTRLILIQSNSDSGVSAVSEEEFHWSLTTQGWDDISELLQPFLELCNNNDYQSKPYHQWLEPHVRLPASSIPVIMTTSVDGRW